MQQRVEVGVERGAGDVLGDVAVAAGGAHRGEDGLAPGQRLEVPETRLAAAQVTGEVEEREVRVRMIARRAHRLEESTETLEQRRRVEDAVVGERTCTRKVEHREQHADFMRTRAAVGRVDGEAAEFGGIGGEAR